MYWYDDDKSDRDYDRGYDSNEKIRNEIIDEILKALKLELDVTETRKLLLDTSIYSITEYGRSVHAEMEALMSCVRTGVSARNGTLYTTTFPCHNCAKHIISAGIKRVVFIEPYVKSKAPILHNDSIVLFHETSDRECSNKIHLQPFTGIGPRKYTDLFSINLSSGEKLKRKDKYGNIVEWKKETAKVRIPMLPSSYIEREGDAVGDLAKIKEGLNE